MYLQEILDAYYKGTEKEKFELWRKAFPKMYEFSQEVEVIPWEEEYQSADVNPEIIDQLKFYEELLKNGLISEKEYLNLTRSVRGFSRKVLGVAFIEENAVAFRDKIPPLNVAIHELGHIFFKKGDNVWSDIYAGGETLMWAIVFNRIEGQEGKNEELVRNYMDIYELSILNPKKGEVIINKVAKRVLKQIGVENPKEFLEKAGWDIEPTPINALLIRNGTLPSKDYQPAHYIQNLMVGSLYPSETIPQLFIKELISKTPQEWLRFSPQRDLKRNSIRKPKFGI